MAAATGANTQFGQIAEKLTQHPPETEFERGVRRFWLFINRNDVDFNTCCFLRSMYYITKPAIDSLLFSVALAVGINASVIACDNQCCSCQRFLGPWQKEGVYSTPPKLDRELWQHGCCCAPIKTGTLTEGIVRLDGAVDEKGQASEIVFRLAYLNSRFTNRNG